MPVTLQPLVVSPAIAASKGALLGELRQLVGRYNLLLPTLARSAQASPTAGPDSQAVKLMDRLTMCGVAYLLQKPPRMRKSSGQAKWNDVAQLLNEVAIHSAQLGAKMMIGNFL